MNPLYYEANNSIFSRHDNRHVFDIVLKTPTGYLVVFPNQTPGVAVYFVHSQAVGQKPNPSAGGTK